MPAKLAPEQALRSQVAPVASNTTEAVSAYSPPPVVQAPGLWQSLKKGAKKIFSKTSSKKAQTAPIDDSSAVEAERQEVQEEEGASILSSVASSGQASAPPVPESSEDQAGTELSGDVQSAPEELDPEQEFKKLPPGEQLAHLYEKLGATDAFLTAVQADPALQTAAVALGSDTVVAFLGKATLSDGAVTAAATGFAGHLDVILAGLSVGAAMTADVRTGLRRVLPGLGTGHAMTAFGKRFNHDMIEAGGTWSLDNIIMVWDQLAVLPDQDVTGLTVLTTFQAIGGGGGFGPSWEAPDVVNSIQLGEDISDPGFMAHTVRHEVGHAVHAEMPGTINPWLQGDIGFWFYGNDAASVKNLIVELGGFPAKFTAPDGTETDWNPGAESWVVDMLKTFIGAGSSWDPARPTVEDGQGDWQTAYWSAMPDSVKDVALQSPSHWYGNYNNFARGTKGSYFLNYWYARSFYMSDTAKAVVDATGDSYTAMSEKEFFANAYAEYFADPAGYHDPTKWGGKLPASVKGFFKKCIVDRQPYAPPDAKAEADAGVKKPTPPPASGMAGTP